MSEQPFTADDYEILEREVLYQGVFTLVRFTLRHRLFDGSWSQSFKREVLERHAAVAILPYDPALDRVILIEQFRPGSLYDPKNPWLIEIPAGVFGKNEKPEEVAVRETKEEAGCEILTLKPIFENYVSPGGSNEYLYIFCGKIAATDIKGIHGLKEEDEDIRVINLPTDEALAMLNRGEIKTTPAIIGLLWLQINRKALQAEWTNF